MAGEYLPPVITTFQAEIGDFVSKVEAAKKAIDSLDSKNIEIGAKVSGIAGPVAGAIAQINALKTAMQGLDNQTVHITADTAGFGRAAATAAATQTAAMGANIPMWHRWLDLIHFSFAVLGENLVADAIGIGAFAVSAVANLGPVSEAISNQGQTYQFLTKMQMGAADSLTTLITRLQGAQNTGVFAVFYQGVDAINQVLGRSGGIVSQATKAFETFAAELRLSLGSPAWQAVIGRASNLIQTDLSALLRFLLAFINMIPGLLHDFNFLGLGLLNALTFIFRIFGGTSELDTTITRLVYGLYLLRRAFLYLWVGMGGGAGPVQRFVVWMRDLAIAVTGTNLASDFSVLGVNISGMVANFRRFGALPTISFMTGLDAAGLATAGMIGVLSAGVVAAFIALSKLPDPVDNLISKLTQQDQAVGDNAAGYQKLANQLNYYGDNVQKAMGRVGGSRAALYQVQGAINTLSTAQRNAANTAINLRTNFGYLEHTYHTTAMGAYQLANAVGINLQKALTPAGKLALQAYEQALRSAQNPLTAVQYGMQQAANTALQLDDRVTGLTNAFNALLTPFANVIQDTVTWSQGNRTLRRDVNAAHGQVKVFGDTAQQLAATDLAQAITNTTNLSSAILSQTGSFKKAVGPIEAEIKVLEGLHSKSSIVAQAIKDLQQYIDNLHSKSVTINTNFTTTGTPPGGPVGGGIGTRIVGATAGSTGTAGPSTVNIRTSAASNQHLARAVQRTLNQKTIRNGGTQLVIAGRNH